MYCKKCGTELRENDTFCYYCGNRIGWMQRMLSSKAFIGSVIAVFVVIIAAVLTYLYGQEKLRCRRLIRVRRQSRIRLWIQENPERIQIILHRRQQLRRH